MIVKKQLQYVQNLIPHTWLEKLQFLHAWLLWKWLLSGGSQPLANNQKSAIIFSPHQDDETFGCGGMIAHKREQGIPVTVVFLTNGQGAFSPELQNHIIQTRQQEAVKALQILGVEAKNIHFLGKPDGYLPDLNHQERHQTIQQIAQLIKDEQPEEIYVPHSKDCHKDHEATYDLVKTAIAQLNVTTDIFQYPVWLFWRSPLFILLKLSDLTAAYKFSIASVQDKKKQAIHSYSSQITNLPRGFIQQFLNTHEIFFKVTSLR
ncbi:PIG-L deacetylase family protein [Nostoc sp. TCL26-01]|uniref:PIG-L deacetylase family protein n=1 Tax=Nostoc sp. TCL26-01 TaxID=2576904 RepID=UPI0015BEE598|nr:PIG-L family deacetylase [Nostoc sp. TCL26-01]QLE56524.1 PIG-L family deacetylase [Nostoc sp. TCL26-01]